MFYFLNKNNNTAAEEGFEISQKLYKTLLARGQHGRSWKFYHELLDGSATDYDK